MLVTMKTHNLLLCIIALFFPVTGFANDMSKESGTQYVYEIFAGDDAVLPMWAEWEIYVKDQNDSVYVADQGLSTVNLTSTAVYPIVINVGNIWEWSTMRFNCKQSIDDLKDNPMVLAMGSPKCMAQTDTAFTIYEWADMDRTATSYTDVSAFKKGNYNFKTASPATARLSEDGVVFEFTGGEYGYIAEPNPSSIGTTGYYLMKRFHGLKLTLWRQRPNAHIEFSDGTKQDYAVKVKMHDGAYEMDRLHPFLGTVVSVPSEWPSAGYITNARSNPWHVVTGASILETAKGQLCSSSRVLEKAYLCRSNATSFKPLRFYNEIGQFDANEYIVCYDKQRSRHGMVNTYACDTKVVENLDFSDPARCLQILEDWDSGLRYGLTTQTLFPDKVVNSHWIDASDSQRTLINETRLNVLPHTLFEVKYSKYSQRNNPTLTEGCSISAIDITLGCSALDGYKAQELKYGNRDNIIYVHTDVACAEGEEHFFTPYIVRGDLPDYGHEDMADIQNGHRLGVPVVEERALTATMSYASPGTFTIDNVVDKSELPHVEGSEDETYTLYLKRDDGQSVTFHRLTRLSPDMINTFVDETIMSQSRGFVVNGREITNTSTQRLSIYDIAGRLAVILAPGCTGCLAPGMYMAKSRDAQSCKIAISW